MDKKTAIFEWDFERPRDHKKTSIEIRFYPSPPPARWPRVAHEVMNDNDWLQPLKTRANLIFILI
jgi:hypothetical protein